MKHRLVRYQPDEYKEQEDEIAVEAEVDIHLDGKRIRTLYATPVEIEELSRGYAYSSGFLTNPKSPLTIRESPIRITAEFITSLTEIWQEPKEISKYSPLEPGRLFKLASIMKESQPLFRATGCAHAALSTMIERNTQFISEDISRHNAIDKTIGKGLIAGVFPNECVLMVTGRLTHTLVMKCCRAGFAAVSSLSVASSAGIQMARSEDLTLIGSVKPSGFWIYHEGKLSMQR